MDTAGNVVGSVTDRAIETPVTGAQATDSGQILDLTLQPLDLDLLGLHVQLDVVHLQITGEQGPRSLLGNLLCGLAGALDNTGGAGGSGILNRILGL